MGGIGGIEGGGGLRVVCGVWEEVVVVCLGLGSMGEKGGLQIGLDCVCNRLVCKQVRLQSCSRYKRLRRSKGEKLQSE